MAVKCGEGIKARRLRAGMTREALAKKSGVSVMTIRRYETLEREPRFDALEKLAAALGCAVFEFTEDREEMDVSIGENIRQARKARGFTQQELANAAGINVQTVRSYEAGKYCPKMGSLSRLAAALGCTVFDFTEDQEDKNMSIGENIRAARKAAGLTQKQLGERLGDMPQQYIAQYETGKRIPKQETLEKFAVALGCSEYDLRYDKKDTVIELNEGYEIVEAEAYRTNDTGRVDRIVLGRMDTKYGVMWVTWESAAYPHEGGRLEYFWGHYHDDERKARADYHRRLIEKYE